MNVSFSTRGWQQIPWEQQVQMAETMRFGGVELYNVHKTPELTGRGGPLHRYTAAATARELWQKGLCIPCFDTACDIAGEDCTETVTALVQLAHDVQCPYVSVTAQRDDDARISAALEALLPAAEAQGITILLKTSGVFSDTARLRTLLDAFACDQLGALWDMHHPYRDHGESADTTIKNLGAYVRHVHLRDSDDDGSYDLIGEGTLPVGSMMQALSSIDYDGFLSLEWKPEWMPDLTDPEVIFPHFVNYMHRFDSPRGKKKTLYDNAAHTGKFVWKKDSLISETFPQVLDRMVEEFPDQYAFKYTTLDYTRTYAQFRDDVDDFARALVSLGVRRGSKVAIWATNVPAWFITFWAATKIGAVSPSYSGRTSDTTAPAAPAARALSTKSWPLKDVPLKATNNEPLAMARVSVQTSLKDTEAAGFRSRLPVAWIISSLVKAAIIYLLCAVHGRRCALLRGHRNEWSRR